MHKLTSSKLSDFALALHCCIYLILTYLFLNFNNFYHSLDTEFGFLELSGALSLFVVSVLLFATAFKAKKISGKKDRKFILLILAGLLFFWACGEEISWGQHFFGLVTPDWLAEINGQNETNIHNINKKFFDRYLERCTFLLVLVTSIFHFRGKDYLWDFKLPEYPLVMGFILMPIYRKLDTFYGHDIWPVGFLVLLVYPYLAFKNKDKKMLLSTLAVIVTALVIVIVHHNNFELFLGKSNIYHEVKEMLFSYLCLFYAIQLYRDV